MRSVRQSDPARLLQRVVPRGAKLPTVYNIAPTDQIPIVRIDPRDGERELVLARWGLIPFWMKEKPKVPHINARAETVHKLPLFREAFAKRRCLIPATGFCEWRSREAVRHLGARKGDIDCKADVRSKDWIYRWRLRSELTRIMWRVWSRRGSSKSRLANEATAMAYGRAGVDRI